MNAEDIKEEIATICRKIKYGFAKRTDVRTKYDLRLAELRKQLENAEMQDDESDGFPRGCVDDFYGD